MQRRVLGGRRKAAQGDNFFVADNPPFGIEFTYFLKDGYKSKAALRKEEEMKLAKNNGTVAVPEWDVLEEELKALEPNLYVFIFDSEGNILKRIKAKNAKGVSRVVWDLTAEPTYTISANNVDRDGRGSMVAPGGYTAQLFKQVEGKYSALGEKVSFEVKTFNKKSALTGSSPAEATAHWNTVTALSVKVRDLRAEMSDTKDAVKIMLKAYERAPKQDEALHAELLKLHKQMLDLEQQFGGSEARAEVGEKDEYPSIWDYLWAASARTTYGPTKAHLKYLSNANKLFEDMDAKLKEIKKGAAPLEGKLEKLGAPKMRK